MGTKVGRDLFFPSCLSQGPSWPCSPLSNHLEDGSPGIFAS